MSSKVIHLCDPQIPRTAIHFLLGVPKEQLTGDPDKVTCRTCRRMVERQKRFRERKEK